MGLLDSIKNKLGIGGVSISLSVPAQIDKQSGMLEGAFTLTTKSKQEISKMEAILEEEFTSGIGDNKKESKYELGKWTDFTPFTIEVGEIKHVDFRITFAELKSAADKMAGKSGMLGGLGKGVKFLNNEKSKYFIRVNVDVKAAVLDPSERKEIRLI